jgi:hypothetical protein
VSLQKQMSDNIHATFSAFVPQASPVSEFCDFLQC